MKSKINKWAVFVLIVLILLIVGGGTFMLGDNYVNIRGQHLVEYRYGSSGDMRGGHYSEIVKRKDDSHAIITIEKAEAYNVEPERNEYLVDISIMDELENVIRKYKMNHWNRKKFTDMFISDGASSSYSFNFDKSYVSFSSQFYPMEYGQKLQEFDEIINKYVE